MAEVDAHKVTVVYEQLQRFIRSGKAEDADVLAAAAERIEVDAMLAGAHGAHRHLLQAAVEYLNHMVVERRGARKSDILGTLGQALSDDE